MPSGILRNGHEIGAVPAVDPGARRELGGGYGNRLTYCRPPRGARYNNTIACHLIRHLSVCRPPRDPGIILRIQRVQSNRCLSNCLSAVKERRNNYNNNMFAFTPHSPRIILIINSIVWSLKSICLTTARGARNNIKNYVCNVVAGVYLSVGCQRGQE